MSNEQTQLYAGKSDESSTTGNGENVSSADNQQGRIKKYRALFSSHLKGAGSSDGMVILMAWTDDEAIAKYNKLQETEKSNKGKFAVSRLYHGLERVDQEELVTRIL